MTAQEALEELKRMANGVRCTVSTQIASENGSETVKREVYIAGLHFSQAFGNGTTWEAALSDIRSKLYLDIPPETETIEAAADEMNAMGGTQ